ncbi:site-specific integrase [Clostridium felsineum]|uniref:site-specific integrase n=1 Tax=Clostridium felsineum TaxID=36839 RepID=UPI00214D5A0E|nr:site-specific integrase [Clostridium felsineum]MCR3761739.1 site-specific integrase [Clostridium felsineum]
MSKRPSVVFQVNEVLRKAFHEGFGRSRHSDKRNAMNNDKEYDTYTKNKIYSQKTYKATNKTCVAFVKHCRENYGIKYLFEINPEMFKSFIEKGDFKHGKPYDPKTAATYYSQILKMQNAYNTINNFNSVFADKSYKNFVGKSEKKKIQMPREIHNQIIKKAYENKYTNGLAFDTARALGLRVTEITNLRKEDFKFCNDKFLEIHIHKSKGGRSRDINIESLTSIQVNTVLTTYNYFKNSLSEHDRLFINKSDSYEKTFSRIRDSITEDYTYCGIHSMRKEFANDYYDRRIQEGIKDEQAEKELTEILGHTRTEVLDSYLK